MGMDSTINLYSIISKPRETSDEEWANIITSKYDENMEVDGLPEQCTDSFFGGKIGVDIYKGDMLLADFIFTSVTYEELTARYKKLENMTKQLMGEDYEVNIKIVAAYS